MRSTSVYGALWLVLLSGACLAASPSAASACTCVPLDVAQGAAELDKATLVFVGRVTSVEPIEGSETRLGKRERVALRVTRRWKGPAVETHAVTSGPQSDVDTCVATFRPGETYLVFASGDHAGSCRVWREGGAPPFAAVGAIAGMKAVQEELDRLLRRPAR